METREFDNQEIADFLDNLDRKFQNRSGTYCHRWAQEESSSLGYAHPALTFCRPLRDMTEYEIFVLKLIELLEFIEFFNDGTTLMEALRASIAYGDGRCTVRYDRENMASIAKMLGPRQYYPHPVADTVRGIERLVGNLDQAASVFPALNRWLQRHVGRSSASAASGSLAFSTTPGPYGLAIGVSETSGQMMHYRGEASLLTIAPPGKGKTQCHVLPTLATYPGPIIALDVKGECYAATHELREHLGHHVIRFAPTEPDPDKSARYNPLAFVDDHPDELWESARFLADLMVLVRSASEPVWETMGKELLTLFIAYTVHTCPEEERTLQKVLDLVSTLGLTEMLEEVTAAGSPYPTAMRRTAARFRQMSATSPKQFEGVLAGAGQHMQVWEGPKIERITAACDWEPEDFRREPCPTLYLCIPPEALDTYAPILRVVIGQHVRQLMRNHERRGPPILFLLDELPRLGQMQPIREALETGRSYGIKLWMFAQYPEQLTNAYPGFGEGMMESCDVRMYMAPTMKVAEMISTAFGDSLNVFGGTPKRVLDPTTILAPEHRESIFVLAAGEEPMILRKRYFHEQTVLPISERQPVSPAAPAPKRTVILPVQKQGGGNAPFVIAKPSGGASSQPAKSSPEQE
ncbi:hypothetical protein CCR97_00290 [Rhodoplanes elegans]|uniref:Conjugal transfer protein TraG n=1 Tax=Rhodoplanes elegans TaxID=29408 RepID=A0A327KL07_9BRAD|nr:type IV secretory system conjugative DNA transfer family protein [Rhodoplanes elegans]MBK5956676.1 hypothetical protein [Rhodoplanes elegans]RAI39187.1 hypothetical protein CH338_10175 [Rhodoplanes elegans]